MKFLLTNDDGIDAPGLAALVEAARPLGEVAVVAPSGARSGCGHRVTTDAPIRICEFDARRIGVDGTPADCVRIALHRFGDGPFWVLSGVNEGGNLGADVHHSGTVAAVREAALHGLPGIAFSQYRRKGAAIDWRRAAAWTAAVLRELLERQPAPGGFWNVNFPCLDALAPHPKSVVCPIDVSPLPVGFHPDGDWLHYRGDYHGRRRQPGTDVDVCFGGRIAVTRLTLR
jgi:5'-nucleotidase